MASAVRRGPARWAWFAGGLASVALGGVGIVLPGVPTTVFFIVAAACFSRSSPRFEAWVLRLPRIGPVVRDHRAGLGMPRRTKAFAIGSMVAMGGLSAVLALDTPPLAAAIAVLVAVGTWYVGWHVPTRGAGGP